MTMLILSRACHFGRSAAAGNSASSLQSDQARSLSLSKILHYAIPAALIVAALGYWLVKPPSLNPLTDPQAAEALALVQTHRAVGYPSILQAFNERVRLQKTRDFGVKLGEWRVQKLEDPRREFGDNRYEVRINLREQGKSQWFEREFIWHVDLATKRVNAASLPADGLMPDAPDTAGAPRGPTRP